MKRRNFLRAGIGTAATLATGCSGLPVKTARRVKGSRPVTIKFVPQWGIDGFARKLADEFTKQNPNVHIEFTGLPGNYDQALLRAYKHGDPYDMVVTGPFYSMWATQSDYTIDLAPLYRRDFGPDYRKLFKNVFVNWQDKIVGVPFWAGTELFYYNQDIIEAAGLRPPHDGWTWDDFSAITRGSMKRTADGQVVQWGCSMLELDMFRVMVGQEDQRLYSRDYRQATIDTPVARSVMALLHELIFKHQVVGTPTQWRSARDDVATSWNHGAFYAGKVALLRDGDLRLKPTYEHAAKTGFKVGVAPPMRRKRQAVGAGPTTFQIWKSPNPDRAAAAWEFTKFWLTPANQARMLLETGRAPVRLAAYDDPAGRQCLQQWQGLSVFRDAYEHADPSLAISSYPTMALEYLGMRPFMYRFMMRRLNVKQMLEQMQAKCQSILDDFWSKADKEIFELFPEEMHK